MAKRRGFPPVYKIERVAKMYAKRVFFGVFQKIMVICCAMFFCFANAFSANLPAGYTELEYIQSTGGQYVDTGVARGSSNFVVEYDINMVTANGARFAFSGASWNVSSYLAFDKSDNTFDVGQGTTESVQGALNTRYKLKAEYKVGSIVLSLYDNNGTLLASATRTNDSWVSSNTDSWLFGTVRDIPSGTSFSYTLKSFGGKIWQGTTLVRDFVPAKNSSGVIGMYDTVNDVFYTNQGTGAFTAGPEVLNPCRNLFDKDASYALFDGYVNNKSVGQSTTLNAYAGGDKTIIIKVAPDTTYTVTRATNLGSVYDRIRCAAFKTLPSDGSTGVILYNDKNTTQANATFTTLSDTQYVAINVRNSGEVGNDWTQFVDAFQLEEGSTATAYVPFCSNSIKIATTAYNTARFSPVVTDLNSAVATIREIVTKTINQTAAIASLQADKQTRPEDACPAGKKCLLVETEENGVVVPHWFPIIENIYGLPAGYTPLEYIESTGGGAYIRLNGYATNDTSFDMIVTRNCTENAKGLYGAASSGSWPLGSGIETGANQVVYLLSGGEQLMDEFITIGTEVHIVQNKNVYTATDVNGTRTRTQPGGEFQTSYPVMVGAITAYGYTRPCDSVWKYFNVSGMVDSDGNVLPDVKLIPAQNASGVVGMYDTVGNVFYTNAGTGTFTAGNPLE